MRACSLAEVADRLPGHADTVVGHDRPLPMPEALGDDGAQAVSIHVYGTDIVTQQRSELDVLAGTERVFRPPFAEAGTTTGG